MSYFYNGRSNYLATPLIFNMHFALILQFLQENKWNWWTFYYILTELLLIYKENMFSTSADPYVGGGRGISFKK